jgi:hypothetical protein
MLTSHGIDRREDLNPDTPPLKPENKKWSRRSRKIRTNHTGKSAESEKSMKPDIKHDNIMRRPLHDIVAIMVWADEIVNFMRKIP